MSCAQCKGSSTEGAYSVDQNTGGGVVAKFNLRGDHRFHLYPVVYQCASFSLLCANPAMTSELGISIVQDTQNTTNHWVLNDQNISY